MPHGGFRAERASFPPLAPSSSAGRLAPGRFLHVLGERASGFSLQSLDLTARRMVHEGPLSWRISKDKSLGRCLGTGAAGLPRGRGRSSRPLTAALPTADLHALLLEDLLVLLQRQDEKLLLKCHSKTAAGSSDSKQTFSPVLKLNAVLVRSVATGTPRGGGSPRSSSLPPLQTP